MPKFIPEDDDDKQAAPVTPVTKKPSGALKFIPEDDTPGPSPPPPAETSPWGYAQAFGEGVVKSVPGGQWAEAKLGKAFGVSEQESTAKQEQLAKDYPGTSFAGQLAGGLAIGALLPGVKGVSLLGKAAVSIGQAALLQPAYKLGDTAHQAQLQQTTPLRVEQVLHSLIPDWDTLQAAGIAAAFHVPGFAAAGVKAVKAAVGRAAVASAERMFPKAAAAGVQNPGKLALERGVLATPDRIAEMQAEAGKTVQDIAAGTAIDAPLGERMGEKLEGIAQKASGNNGLKGGVADLYKQASMFKESSVEYLNAHGVLSKAPPTYDGTKVQDVISSFRTKAQGIKDPSLKQMYDDAAHAVYEEFGAHIETLNPEHGLNYRNATDDFSTFSKMAKEAKRGAAAQGDLKSLAKKYAAPTLIGTAGAAVGGGVPGAMAGAAIGMAVNSKAKGGNYAVLMDNFAKSPPLANSMRRTAQLLDVLVDGAPALAANASRNTDEIYNQMVHTSRAAMVDPQATAEKIRSQVDFLHPLEADAVTSHTMTRLQESAAAIPNNGSPPTAFGDQTAPTNRQKREFIDRVNAKFDPYAAVMSGRADLIAEAEKHNPETMHLIKRQILDAISTKKLSYSTKRRLSAILGVAGVPSQDPTLGAMLQQVIQEKREASSQAGQMDSARQAHAAMKNNKATLSRAQKLLE